MNPSESRQIQVNWTPTIRANSNDLCEPHDCQTVWPPMTAWLILRFSPFRTFSTFRNFPNYPNDQMINCDVQKKMSIARPLAISPSLPRSTEWPPALLPELSLSHTATPAEAPAAGGQECATQHEPIERTRCWRSVLGGRRRTTGRSERTSFVQLELGELATEQQHAGRSACVGRAMSQAPRQWSQSTQQSVQPQQPQQHQCEQQQLLHQFAGEHDQRHTHLVLLQFSARCPASLSVRWLARWLATPSPRLPGRPGTAIGAHPQSCALLPRTPGQVPTGAEPIERSSVSGEHQPVFGRLRARLVHAANASATATILELHVDLQSAVSFEPHHADRRLRTSDRLTDLVGVQHLVQPAADSPGGTTEGRPSIGARVGALPAAQHPAARLSRSWGAENSR